jgi:cytochrome c oxidase subunit 3
MISGADMDADKRSAEDRATEDRSAGARIGMWLFLLSEILLFGGLFLLYSVYRFRNPADFHAMSLELSRFAGTLNTVVLLTSSLAVALAIHAVREQGNARRGSLLVTVTMALGLVFLVVKGFEWAEKFRHGLYPGSPALLARPPGEMLFVGLYFTMTGLHALHLIIGLGVLAVMLVGLRRGTIGSGRPAPLENAGLYWHLVDLVWIFLFPLFYLIS